MLSTNTDVGLDNLITIYLRCYRNITESLATFSSAVNLAPNVEVCTTVLIFDDHVLGADPTTENILVIDLIEILM